MKTLKSTNVVHDNDYTKFPQGAILNETTINEGTPVVREVYNDVLQNVYKIITSAGIQFNNLEDNEQSGYQLFEALKLLFSSKNNTEFILNKDQNSFRINSDLSKFENKSFIIARASDDYDSNINIFKGSTNLEYNFISQDFKSGDELLIILDHSGVRSYNISSNKDLNNSGANVIDYPIQFLSSLSDIFYQNDNKIFNKIKDFNLQEILGKELEILNVFSITDSLIVLILSKNDNKIQFFNIKKSDQSFFQYAESGFSFDNVINRNIFAYFDGSNIYLSNNSGTSDDDFRFQRLEHNLAGKYIEFKENLELDADFLKTTNSVFYNNGILNFLNGIFTHFSFVESTQLIKTFESLSNFAIFRDSEKIYLSDAKTYTELIL